MASLELGTCKDVQPKLLARDKLLLLGVLTGSSSKQGWRKTLDASVEIAEAALCSQMLEVLGEVGCTGQHPGPAVSQRGLYRAVLLTIFRG